MCKKCMDKRTVLRVVLVSIVGLVFPGCAPPEKKPPAGPVFFPKAPDAPRLQFLKSYSNPEDLDAPAPSALELFIVGEPEITDRIKIPYGMAMHDGKLYVCDVGRGLVEILDFEGKKFGYLTQDRRLLNPVNIHIEPDGTKYIADPRAGAVFVFDRNNNLSAMLGKDLGIAPLDVVVRGEHCYVTEFTSNQVVVLDKRTGHEIKRIGQGVKRKAGQFDKDEAGKFELISDLAFDTQGNLYVSDKSLAVILNFDQNGILKRTIGRRGDAINEFVRPKGIAIDRADRIWIVDAAPEVAKIYDNEGSLLLFFGFPGNRPGMMNLPANIIVDYDHVHLFEKYAVAGAELEFLVLVSNQYGLNKINVYGFGSFPENYQQLEPPQQE